MSGTFEAPRTCAAAWRVGSNIANAARTANLTVRIVSLLFWRSLVCVGSRYARLQHFSVRQRQFKQQACGLAVDQGRDNGFYFVARFDHVGSPPRALHHIDAGTFDGE